MFQRLIFRIEIFGVLFYIIAFIPASNLFITVGYVIAERALYLPSIGFFIICSCIYERFECWLKETKIEMIPRKIAFILIVLLTSKSLKVRKYSVSLLVCEKILEIYWYLIAQDTGDQWSSGLVIPSR